MNLNTVSLQGNLVRDPEVRFLQSGTCITKFSIAVNDRFGENKTTAFIDCVSFGKQGEIIGKHFNKGKQIIVKGKLVQSQWEDKESGKSRSKLEVRLDNYDGFFFVGSNGKPAEEETIPEEAPKTDTKDGKLF